MTHGFRVISAGTGLVAWRDIRRIRATFPTEVQTLYRLKSISFPLWNWAANDLSCPNTECDMKTLAPTSHVFWSCTSAQRRWAHLRSLWRCLGAFDEADMHVWVFAMELPGQPSAAWTAVQRSLAISVDRYKAKSAVFHAANELWRFVVSSSLHAIWIERLNRMRDPTLPEEMHISRATSHLRRALTRFRSSVYQPEGGDDGQILAQVRSALADTLLLHDEPFPLRSIRLADQPGVLYLLFFDGGSRGNPGPGGSGSVIVKLHVPTHTAGIVWVASMAYGNPTTTNNFAEYQGLVHSLHRAKEGVLSSLHVVGDSALGALAAQDLSLTA